MSSCLEPALGPMQKLMTEPWAMQLAYEITTDLSRSALSEYNRLAEAALDELDKLDVAVQALDDLALPFGSITSKAVTDGVV